MLFRFGAFQAVRSEVVRRGGFGRGFRGEGQSNRASGGDWWPYCSESGVLLIVIVERAAPTLRSPYRSLVVALIDPFTGTLFYLLGPCSISRVKRELNKGQREKEHEPPTTHSSFP